MASRRTWIWIVLIFLGICVTAMMAVAGAGIYFVSSHIDFKSTTMSDAGRTFEEVKASFKEQKPLFEIDSYEHAKALRPLASLSDGQSRNGLESEDGTMRIVPVVTNQPTLSQPDCAAMMEKVRDFRRRVVQSWSGPAPEVMVTGRSAYVAEIAASMQRDISVTSTISILSVTALFYFGFRRLIPGFCRGGTPDSSGRSPESTRR